MAQRTEIKTEDWQAYKTRFVSDSGRVIDDANGNISHSESQGYGLLLAYLAGSKADFDLIWSFTRTEFLLRDDGLAVWKWDPNSTPHVTDSNNASDGDILIAYALDARRLGVGSGRSDGNCENHDRNDWQIQRDRTQEKLLLLPAVNGFSAYRTRGRADHQLVLLDF